ncbi:MAG TPA: MBL fold metallo-hydrolase [Deltaproteobacteria bacterium]|nr:MBL fold metallo-hydrolase [Deltaproteobacteria bacterium]
MRRVRITPNLEYIEPQGRRKLYACAGLALSGRVKTVIDANPGRDKTRDLLKSLNPDIAIVSHYHTDHSSWAEQALQHTKAEIMIPHDEERYFRSFDHVIEHAAGRDVDESLWRSFSMDLLSYREIRTYVTYDSPCSFILGDVSLECIRTAGHSPGHTSFYFPGLKILFTSDMGIDRLGPWYGWRDCSIEETVESILHLRSLDVGLLLTSHGGIITRDIERCWDRALSQILDREQRIIHSLDMGKTQEEIIHEGVCYPRKDKVKELMRSFLTSWDTVMLDHHMKILGSTTLCRLFPALYEVDPAVYGRKKASGAR